MSILMIVLRLLYRFCLYPQELVLLLREPTRVRKLQILSHQFLIRKYRHVSTYTAIVRYDIMMDLRSRLVLTSLISHFFCLNVMTMNTMQTKKL